MVHPERWRPNRGPGDRSSAQGSPGADPTAWQIIAGIECVALLISLVMPVTPGKTGSDWSPAELITPDPGYVLDVAVYFVLTNLLMAALAVGFIVYQRWTRGDGPPTGPAVLAVVAALAGCAEPMIQACEPFFPGLPLVEAVGEGRRAGPESFIELWRRGGGREGEELAYPMFPAASLDGRLAIPDFGLSEVIVIAPDGNWEGSWGRRGQGPGELGSAVAASWTGAGDLVVFDVLNSKVLRYRDGVPAGPDTPVRPEFVGPLVASGEIAWAGVRPDGSALLGSAWAPVGPDSLRALVLAQRPETGSVDTLVRATVPSVSLDDRQDWPAAGFVYPAPAMGIDGALALPASDGSYRFSVRPADGSGFQVCRLAGPLPLTGAERGEEAPDGLEALGAALAAATPERPAAIGRLVLGARGRIWIQRDRPSPYPGSGEGQRGVPGATVDVFESDGAFRGSVRLPDGAALQAARGDTVWMFETGDYDEVYVVAYRIAW